MKVCELTPGDVLEDEVMGRACFVARCPHPLYGGLDLVIFLLEDGTWSHDALSPVQELQQTIVPGDRTTSLRAALHERKVRPAA